MNGLARRITGDGCPLVSNHKPFLVGTALLQFRQQIIRRCALFPTVVDVVIDTTSVDNRLA